MGIATARAITIAASVIATTLNSGSLLAQQTKQQTRAPAKAAEGKPAASAPEQAPARPAWNAVCTSASRQGEVDCAMEQTAVLTQTGQLVTKVVVRVPGSTRAPLILLQLPMGLYLPGGIGVEVDDNKPEQFSLQTCDAHGCYGGGPLSKELLGALEHGSRLTVTFQNPAQEKIKVPMAIGNFAEAYTRIK
jgi:invasion protein IalB